MKNKTIVRRAISEIALFVSACVLMTLAFHSCQKEEDIVQAEEIGYKSEMITEISLIFHEEVTAGEDFDISFSSSCGKIMIERGFIEELDATTGETIYVYSGLNCDTEDLMWEEIGTGGFSDCGGGTLTQNLTETGTYVYRAKLNFSAKRFSGCPDCDDFRGNRFECFMITVAETASTNTFTDQTKSDKLFE